MKANSRWIKLLSSVLCIALIMTFMPAINISAATTITSVTGTSNINPKPGDSAADPSFTVTSGSPATIYTGTDTYWQRYTNGSWQYIDSGTAFNGGDQLRYHCFVRISGSSNVSNYDFPTNKGDLTVTIDGQNWTIGDHSRQNNAFGHYDQYEIFSPVYTLGYTVTFNRNGFGTAPAAQTVNPGEKATRPADPAATYSYVFDGWYTESSCRNAYDFDTPVNSNITLYAKWATKHTVTFHSDYGTVPTPAVIASGKTLQDPGISSEKYSFDGWYNQKGTQKYDFPLEVTRNLDLYAHWTPKCVVDFDMGGRGTQIATQYVTKGETAAYPTGYDIFAGDYTFDGFYSDKTFQNYYLFNEEVNKDTTIYVKWKLSEFSVSFYDGGLGASNMPKTQTIPVNGYATRPATDPSLTGYKFLGWYDGLGYDANEFNFENHPITERTQVYARFAKIYYLTFDMQGNGNPVPSQAVAGAEKVTRPSTDPSAAGWTFGGWYIDKACKNEFIFDTALSQDTVAYAKWTQGSYTVSFNWNYPNDVTTTPAANPANQTVPGGEKVSPTPAVPTIVGYVFTGWYDKKDGGNKIDLKNTAITDNMDLYGHWNKKTVYIQFVSNAPEGCAYYVRNKPYDINNIPIYSVVPEPTQKPWLIGYQFQYWAAGSTRYDWDAPITSDIYPMDAIWQKMPDVNVTFVANNGTNTVDGMPTPTTVPYLMTIVAPSSDPTCVGYEFKGWYKDSGCTEKWEFQGESIYDGTNAADSETKIYAKWEKKTCTVSFDTASIGTAPSDQTVDYLGYATMPTPSPFALGYDFLGWYTDGSYNEQFDFNTTKITGKTTVYGKWSDKITYTVRFNNEGHGSVVYPQTVAKYDVAADIGKLTEDGWTFIGWFLDLSDKDPYDFSTAVTSDIELHAKWSQITYTVDFDLGGLTVTPAIADQTVAHGEKASRPADPSVDGYRFDGWFTDDQYGSTFDFAKGITAKTTVYAKFTKFWNVTFDVGNVGATTVAPQVIDDLERAARPADPSADGYRFDGWYTNNTSYDTEFDFDKVQIADTTVIYAKWVKACTVSFDNNGHGSKPADQKVDFDTTATEPSPAPEEEGWFFDGWYDKTTDKKFVFSNKITADTELYAKWTQLKYTVYFDLGGLVVTPAIPDQTVVYGAAATMPGDPYVVDYVFEGWYTDNTFGKEFDFNTPITGDTNVFAKFTKPAITYAPYSGDNGTWTKDSGKNYVVVIKRSVSDETCFSHFSGQVNVDGTPIVIDQDYTAEAGSTVITLNAAYLQTLSVGDHTLTAFFDDGSTQIKFKIVAPASGNVDPSPKTADNRHIELWITLMITSLICLAGVTVLDQKKRMSNR